MECRVVIWRKSKPFMEIFYDISCQSQTRENVFGSCGFNSFRSFHARIENDGNQINFFLGFMSLLNIKLTSDKSGWFISIPLNRAQTSTFIISVKVSLKVFLYRSSPFIDLFDKNASFLFTVRKLFQFSRQALLHSQYFFMEGYSRA